MTREELILFALIGAVVLIILAKLWRLLFKIAIVAALIVGVVWAIENLPSRNGGSAPLPADPLPERPPDTGAQPGPVFKPDLVILDASPTAPATPGGPFRYIVTVQNQGNGPYGGFVPVTGLGPAQGGFRGIEPGETKSVTIDVSLAPGSTFTFTVDPENQIVEWSDTNNHSRPVTTGFP